MLSFAMFFFHCKNTSESNQSDAVHAVLPKLPERPNILWLVAEDMSPVIRPFGDSTIQTPMLERLAAEGVRYTHLFSTHGVCAPSRSAIATGMYPIRIGTNHMRTSGNPDYLSEGLVPYSAVVPPEVKMHSEYLRMAGYYCTNNAKEDYQFARPQMAWDECSRNAHWRNRPDPKQPFFAIFNFNVTHESQIWVKKNDSLLVDPATVPIPPYYPNTPKVRQDVARMYSNVVEMDGQIAKIIQQLEEDGLLENTVIFWYTDHGGPLPRQKRELYDSGLRAPMMIRFPNKSGAGEIDNRLLSFVDLLPTVMSIAGEQPPGYLDGKAFVGEYADARGHDYIFGARDRLDSEYDHVRAVRDRHFKYIRNLRPDLPNKMAVQYRQQMDMMNELDSLSTAGALSGAPAIFFNKTKPKEELYDLDADPFEINNIAADPAQAAKLQELSTQMDAWLEDTQDKGIIPEVELLLSMWLGKIQPVTATPVLEEKAGKIHLSCTTAGASIGYAWMHPDSSSAPKSWQVYTGPFEPVPGKKLMTTAHRIGYKPSE